MKKRDQINMFGEIVGELLGVSKFEFLDPEERQERERKKIETKTIHLVLHDPTEKKRKKTALEEFWSV